MTHASESELRHARERIQKWEGVLNRARSVRSIKYAQSELAAARYALARKLGHM